MSKCHFHVTPLHCFRSKMTWLSRIPSWGGGQFSVVVAEVRRDGQRFKAAGTGWPRHYGTQLFKQLIVRQRRPQPAFRGRYEQTVDDVYSRLPQLTTKGVWLGERQHADKRKKKKNKSKAIEHFSLLADIVVCLFVGCARAVEECCFQEWIIVSTGTTYLFQRHRPNKG